MAEVRVDVFLSARFLPRPEKQGKRWFDVLSGLAVLLLSEDCVRNGRDPWWRVCVRHSHVMSCFSFDA
jgi:hypothetical protein